jgi:serine acetyltransferase
MAPIARTEAVGDEESVGPGVSVGVTEGEAPIRRVGVGLGVSVGVTVAVIDELGVGV